MISSLTRLTEGAGEAWLPNVSNLRPRTVLGEVVGMFFGPSNVGIYIVALLRIVIGSIHAFYGNDRRERSFKVSETHLRSSHCTRSIQGICVCGKPDRNIAF